MLQQENTIYRKADYIDDQQKKNAIVNTAKICRKQIVSWCLDVSDVCNTNREIVDVAMSYFDRFMMTPVSAAVVLTTPTTKTDTRGVMEKSAAEETVQIIAITCLYTAFKIHAPAALSPRMVVKLARKGAFCCCSGAQIVTMESCILEALQWRVNPPTANDFVRNLLRLIPQHFLGEASARQGAYEIATFQIEQAIGHYDLAVTVKTSTIAFCSLMNAMECVCLDLKVVQQISELLSQALLWPNNDDSSKNDAVQHFLVRITNPFVEKMSVTSAKSVTQMDANVVRVPTLQQSPTTTTSLRATGKRSSFHL